MLGVIVHYFSSLPGTFMYIEVQVPTDRRVAAEAITLSHTLPHVDPLRPMIKQFCKNQQNLFKMLA